MNNKGKITIVLFLIAVGLIVCNSMYSNTSENFSSDCAKPTVVFYHASWCGFCKLFKPEFEKFENKIKNNGINVKIEQIECNEETKKECSFLNGYPTVLFIKNNKIIPYDGERKAKELYNFVLKNLE